MEVSEEELDERMQNCEKLSQLLEGTGEEVEQTRFIPKMEDLLQKYENLRTTYDNIFPQMKSDLHRMRDALDKIREENGRYNPDNLLRLTDELEQAQYDMLVVQILGRENCLDRLRAIDNEHRTLLFNVENELLSRKAKELEAMNDALSTRVSLLTLDQDELRRKKDKYKRALNSTRQELSIKSGQLSRSLSSESDLRNQIAVKDAEIQNSEADSRQSLEEKDQLLRDAASQRQETLKAKDIEIADLSATAAERQRDIEMMNFEIRDLKSVAAERQIASETQNLLIQIQRDHAQIEGDWARRERDDARQEAEEKQRGHEAQTAHLESKVKERDQVISTLEDLLGSLMSRSRHSIHQDLPSWSLFSQTSRDVVWVQGVRPASPWTLLLPWGVSALEDNFDGNIQAATGLLGMLARLYCTSMETEHTLQLLRLLTQTLATAGSIPLQVVLVVFDRLLDNAAIATESESLELSSVALLQALKSMRGRLSNPDADRVRPVEARAAALVTRCGTRMARLAEILEDGERFVASWAAIRDNGEETDLSAYRAKGRYFPGCGLCLAKLPDARNAVVILSVADRTARLVRCDLGGWDSRHTRYRIRSRGDGPDVVLEDLRMRDSVWITGNMTYVP